MEVAEQHSIAETEIVWVVHSTAEVDYVVGCNTAAAAEVGIAEVEGNALERIQTFDLYEYELVLKSLRHIYSLGWG